MDERQSVLTIFTTEVSSIVGGHSTSFMWMKLDGTPLHYLGNLRNFSSTVHLQHWVGCHGPISWPLMLPNLTSIGFYLGGHLKTYFLCTEVSSAEDLWQRV
jgi:hypothetical protein